MTDERPRPQFGEYATPEEQRAHIRGPLPDDAAPQSVGTASPSGGGPADAPRAAGGARTHVLPPLPGERRRGTSASGTYSGSTRAPITGAERIITLILLAFGAVSVLLNVPTFLSSWSEIVTIALETYGAPASIVNAEHPTWPGLVISLILVVGYVATVWLSLRRLRGGRSAWWIPLVGAAVCWILVTFVMMADPSLGQLAQWMQETGRSPLDAPTP